MEANYTTESVYCKKRKIDESNGNFVHTSSLGISKLLRDQVISKQRENNMSNDNDGNCNEVAVAVKDKPHLPLRNYCLTHGHVYNLDEKCTHKDEQQEYPPNIRPRRPGPVPKIPDSALSPKKLARKEELRMRNRSCAENYRNRLLARAKKSEDLNIEYEEKIEQLMAENKTQKECIEQHEREKRRLKLVIEKLQHQLQEYDEKDDQEGNNQAENEPIIYEFYQTSEHGMQATMGNVFDSASSEETNYEEVIAEILDSSGHKEENYEALSEHCEKTIEAPAMADLGPLDDIEKYCLSNNQGKLDDSAGKINNKKSCVFML